MKTDRELLELAAKAAGTKGQPKGTPQTFEMRGTSYIGYAIALQGQVGSEIIIVAPTKDEAELAANTLGTFSVDRAKIKKAAVVGMRTLAKLEK